jgi:uncharacterized protein with ParB-like and HNH nuclease domain/predicted transport protein
MKAVEARLLDFLKRSDQFVIPIYQRTYSWGEPECRQLWNDILRTGRSNDVLAHFVGSFVYIQKDPTIVVSGLSPALVIDGQQRLTTVELLIEALARSLGDSEPVDGFSARKLRNYYLLNPEEDGERKYKLLLTQTDKASLMALMDQQPKPKEYSIRVESNFEFFRDRVAEAKLEVEVVCRGLAKLVIVDISLTRGQDNPQLIFESLNSTGRELSQADLIRNYILMGLESPLQTKLYEHYWRPMEVDFGQEAYTTSFDSFLRHYLTVKTGRIPNVRGVYEAFKQYSRLPEVKDVETLVANIRVFASYYCAMALGTESNPDLKPAFQDLRELKVDVAYPFLLELYHDYATRVLSAEDLLRAVRLVESYVFRRAICAIPTNSMDKTFASLGRALEKHKYLESIQAYLLLQQSYRRFPSNEESEREFQSRDLYNFPRRSYFFRRLENYGRKEKVSVDEYTIEHILPQNPNLSPQWQAELGPEWQRIQKMYLHTLGNLTLTGYNSEYSDHPFAEKRDWKSKDGLKQGFKDSPLQLNQGLGQLEHWTEQTVCQRAERLAHLVAQVWVEPHLDPAVLDSYKPKTVAVGYSIDDHPNLAAGQMRPVYEVLRKEVLALDPCVTEEFLKYYVAFKAETNFLDVVPQAKQLRLYLTIEPHEVADPRGICKDVSAVGHWANGNTEVSLSSINEIPYVVGLVRQSLEKQMGSGDSQ